MTRSGTFSGCMWAVHVHEHHGQVNLADTHCLHGTILTHHSIHLCSTVLGAKNTTVNKTKFPASGSLYSKGEEARTTKHVSCAGCSAVWSNSRVERGQGDTISVGRPAKVTHEQT